MEPLVSVIVPIYKVEAYLDRCLESITNQTYQNLEIILVDDGSPDRCPAICDAWAEKDQRIRVIHQENTGVAAARNIGLDTMQGDFLYFVDADDWLSLDAVQCLYERLVQDQSDMAIGQMTKVYDDGHTQPSYCAWMKSGVISGEEGIAMLATQTPIPCYVWGNLVSRAVYQNIRFPMLRRGEDVWVLPHVLSACQTISLESKVLYYYYQRPSSIVHSSKDIQWLDSAAGAFHVVRFLMEREMLGAAAHYCAVAVAQLHQVQDVKLAKQLLSDTFSRREWRELTRQNPRCWLYWSYFYSPKLYTMLRKLREKLRQGS